MTDQNKIASFVIMEAVITIIAAFAAFLGAWQLFAALAFWSLLLPIWAVAFAQVYRAFQEDLNKSAER